MAEVQRLPFMGNGVDIDREDEVMRATRTVRRSGGSMVVTVPREMLENVGWEEGDDVILEAEMLGDQICIKELDAFEEVEDPED